MRAGCGRGEDHGRAHMRFVICVRQYDVFSDPTWNPGVRGGGTLQFTMSDATVGSSRGREPGWKLRCFPRSRGVRFPLGKAGGARRDRTDDLMLAKHALYQLSYGPSFPRGRHSESRHRSVVRPPKGHTRCGGPRRTRTADLTLIRRVL